MIHIAEGFGVVNKAKVDVFLELSCFFADPADLGNLTSGSLPQDKLKDGRGIEIKLPIPVVLSKKQESSRKTSTFALLTMTMPLTVWITTNCGKCLEMGIPNHLTCLLRNLCAGQEATV